MGKFRMEMSLDSMDMESVEFDVADLLRKVARKVEGGPLQREGEGNARVWVDTEGTDHLTASASILDINGNTIGQWDLSL